MANEIRLRSNNISGTTTDNPLTIGATTINSPGFVDLPTVDTTNHLILILDPTETNGAAEIVKVTAHAAASSTVTVVRGFETTTPRQHNLGTTWMHGPVASDFTGPRYSASARSAADQAIAGGGNAQVVLATENFDPANRFASNAYSVPVTGLYLVNARTTYAATATVDNRSLLVIRVNNVEAARDDISDRGTQNGDIFTRSVTALLSLTAGQSVDLQFQAPVGAVNLLSTLCYLEITYFGDVS